MLDPITQFRDRLMSRGIIPPAEIIADGCIHRCDTEGKRGKRDAAYLLHLDGIPAGGYENHRDGLGWQNWRMDTGKFLSPEEDLAYRMRVDETRKLRDAERLHRQQDARKRASQIYNSSEFCEEHPYLKRKGIQAHGVKAYGQALLIPVQDNAGLLHSLQFISPDGAKQFLTGGRVRGCYYLLGTPAEVMCVTEGFATAASIYESTGYPVAVAFNATNLLSVAKELRQHYPNAKLVICADDDHQTFGNPGRTKGAEAAAETDAIFVLPHFGIERLPGASDFNDLAQANGKEAVRRCIEEALVEATHSSIAQHTEIIEEAREALQGETHHDKSDVPIIRFNGPGGEFEVTPNGVFFTAASNNGHENAPRWICAPLYVRAKTRDVKSSEWGLLLNWKDDDGVTHQWAMPMELLQGDGGDVRRELSRQGLNMSSHKTARDLLCAYLTSCPVDPRVRCVDQLGWHESVYITPSRPIGNTEEMVVFQNRHATDSELSISGSVDNWREHIGSLAVGNSRLVFALSVAFAAPLLHLVGEDSGGFHLRGSSSTGKTTALKVAASVWGNPSTYTRLWRATANGLEGLAALHNDGLLILDELSQIDPREAGEAAYLLANGQGKTRASRSGIARAASTWRLMVLSSGEESLKALMDRAGKRVNAGQEIRLADIEADAGAHLGLFEELHGHSKPATFSQALKEAAKRYHGAVGISWLEHVVRNQDQIRQTFPDQIRTFVEKVVPEHAAGQVVRVARRFALLAFAGELATRHGLTGWMTGDATNAAEVCFSAWLDAFGDTGTREERAILNQVRKFFELHGASRFEGLHGGDEQRVPNRAGFFRNGADGKREYLIMKEVYESEICQGYDTKTVTKVLLSHNWITPGNDGKSTQKPRIPGLGTPRCHVFNANMWEDDR